jgi:hypothetical protein
MKKVFSAPKKEERVKRRLNVRVPEKMVQEIEAKMKEDGFNSKQRSEWISRAILDLEKIESFSTFISEEWIVPGKNILLQVSIDSEANYALEKIVLISKKELNSDDLQSSVIRTAILQKLI